MAGGAFDVAQYGTGGDMPPEPDALALGEELDVPEIDPDIEAVAVAAFPDLEGQTDRLSALIELINLISMGG